MSFVTAVELKESEVPIGTIALGFTLIRGTSGLNDFKAA
jgi:hypothetical protein